MKPTTFLLTTIGALFIGAALLPSEAPGAKPAPASRSRERSRGMHEAAPAPRSTPAPSAAGSFDHDRMRHQLSAVRDPQVRALTDRALTSTSAQEKGACADSLALSGSHEATESLITLAALQDDPAHRAAILEGLNNLTAADGLTTLASTLAATQDAGILAAATSALARAGNAETLTALVDFYRERNEGPQQKNAVLHAIASLCSPEAQPALAKLAATAPEPALADAARLALANTD